MKKRVCLDIRACQKGSRFTGTGIYAFQLGQSILQTESDLDFFFLVLKGYSLPWPIPADRIIAVTRPRKPQFLQEMFDVLDVRALLKRHHISLLHSLVPGMIVPSRGLRVAVTVHDIIPDILPEEKIKSRLVAFVYKTKMRRAAKANHILVDSDATAVDLARVYEVPKEKITTVYLGSQLELLAPAPSKNDAADARAYILYLGGFNQRKNLKLILRSFAEIAETFPDTDLVIAGKPSAQQRAEIDVVLSELNCPVGRIVWRGFVNDEDLPEIYAGCECFVYPSLYEGFGLPVLEAMQFGAPVITSNISSIPEIVGEAGITIDPSSHEQLTEAIRKVLADKDLRIKLREAGIERAKLFSWKRCLEETISCYKKIIQP